MRTFQFRPSANAARHLTSAAGLLALAAGLTTPAKAQPGSPAARIEEIARYSASLPACQKVGFQLGPGWMDELPNKAVSEVEGLGMSKEEADRQLAEAMRIRRSVFDSKSSALLSGPGSSGPNFGSNVLAWLKDQSKDCVVIARDPLFAPYVRAPVSFDPAKSARTATDELIAPGGLASWQTAQIRARGDVVMAAAACRHQIGAARSDALFKQWATTTVERERAYYKTAYNLGLSSDDLQELTAAQCERAITRLGRKAGGAQGEANVANHKR